MPSPTMATFLPSAWSFFTASAFSRGSTSASTRSTPTCLAIAWAVRSLSPVIITTSMPMPRSFAIAAALDFLGTSATAMIPAALLDRHEHGVLPCAAMGSMSPQGCRG